MNGRQMVTEGLLGGPHAGVEMYEGSAARITRRYKREIIEEKIIMMDSDNDKNELSAGDGVLGVRDENVERIEQICSRDGVANDGLGLAYMTSKRNHKRNCTCRNTDLPISIASLMVYVGVYDGCDPRDAIACAALLAAASTAADDALRTDDVALGTGAGRFRELDGLIN
jgi:hypothetical protein